MRGAVLEGGIYFLLFFTPLAFGGVELWALGVVQIVSGLVVACWTWPFLARRSPTPRTPAPSLRSLWVTIGLFVALVLLQVTPLPASAIRALSPAVDELYRRTIPGHEEGEPFEAAALPVWAADRLKDRIPAGLDAEPGPRLTADQIRATGIAVPRHPGSTLSVHAAGTGRRLVLFLCLAGLFAAVVGHFDTRERLSRLTNAAILAAFVVTVVGILQKLAGNGKLLWLREGDYTLPFGPFVNKNHYATFAGLVLPLALSTTLRWWRRYRGGDRSEATPRLLFSIFAAVILAAGILLSMSRGGMLAAALSVVILTVLLWRAGRSRPEVALLLLVLCAVVGFLAWLGPQEVVERVGTIAEGRSDPSMNLRLLAWRQSLDLIRDHPIFGTGLGTFRDAFLLYAPPGRAWWTNAHNEYVELICDTGIVGGLLLAAGLVFYASAAAGTPARGSGNRRYMRAGLIAGLAAALIHAATTNVLQIPANGILFVTLAGVLLALARLPALPRSDAASLSSSLGTRRRRTS